MEMVKILTSERGALPIGDWISLITALGPLIMELIKMIERLFTGAAGSEKKAIAMAYAREAIPKVDGAPAIPDTQLSAMIDNGVNFLNRAKVFTHKCPGKVDLPFESLF